jgi:hypothetical protein
MVLSLVNTALERMWKKVAVLEFQILCRNLPGGTEENHKPLITITGTVLHCILHTAITNLSTKNRE